MAPAPCGPTLLDAAAAGRARRLLDIRRRRERSFGPLAALFRDPVWDIMLELACAEAEGRPFYVSCAGIAASIPATTALRCLERMICKGLLVRREDPLDKRRSLLSLTSAAVGPLSAFLADMDGVEPLAAADRR